VSPHENSPCLSPVTQEDTAAACFTPRWICKLSIRAPFLTLPTPLASLPKTLLVPILPPRLALRDQKKSIRVYGSFERALQAHTQEKISPVPLLPDGCRGRVKQRFCPPLPLCEDPLPAPPFFFPPPPFRHFLRPVRFCSSPSSSFIWRSTKFPLPSRTLHPFRGCYVMRHFPFSPRLSTAQTVPLSPSFFGPAAPL